MKTKELKAEIEDKLMLVDGQEGYTVKELLEQYCTLNAIEAFENTPQQLISTPAPKTTKQIALAHAEKVFVSDLSSAFDKPQDLLDYAEKVYQWLIK